MNPISAAKSHDGLTLRQAALVAGFAYLFNPVSYAEVSIYPKLVAANNAAQTVQNISAHLGLFAAAILCYIANLNSSGYDRLLFTRRSSHQFLPDKAQTAAHFRRSGVPSAVPKLPNEVTLGEIWCASATVSDWDCSASHWQRQLLNRYTG
jgi:hypothetical protein